MTLNFWSFYLYLLNAGVAGKNHHTQFWSNVLSVMFANPSAEPQSVGFNPFNHKLQSQRQFCSSDSALVPWSGKQSGITVNGSVWVLIEKTISMHFQTGTRAQYALRTNHSNHQGAHSFFSLPTTIIIEITLPKYTRRSSFSETLVSIRSLDVT